MFKDTKAFSGCSVDDIQAARQFHSETLGPDARGIARGEGPNIAWFTDPAGNILSVLEEQ